ncbi:MAG: hypothetical protein ACPLZD_08605 [Candidatus Saccharicenans sp.]
MFKKKSDAKNKKALHLSFSLMIFLTMIVSFGLLSGQTPRSETRMASPVKKVTSHKARKMVAPATTAPDKTQQKNQAKKPSENKPQSNAQPKLAINQQILKENKFLEEEYTLAKNPQYYFVINLKDKKTELRARGMVLKSWIARQIKYAGKPVPLKVTALVQKSALNPPKRKLIKPGESEVMPTPAPSEKDEKGKTKSKKSAPSSASPDSDEFQLEALEITDMPTTYELILDNGLKISVRSKTSGKQKLHQAAESFLWYVWLPVKNFLINRKNPETRMIIYFDNPREAQGLYWAFIDGIKGIIWLP